MKTNIQRVEWLDRVFVRFSEWILIHSIRQLKLTAKDIASNNSTAHSGLYPLPLVLTNGQRRMKGEDELKNR